MIICPKCNSMNPDDSMFCENCGSALEVSTGEEIVSQSEKKGLKGWQIAAIVVSVVLILAIIAGLVWWFVLKDKDSAENDSDNSVSAEEDEDEDSDDEETSVSIDNKDEEAEDKSNSEETTKAEAELTTVPEDEKTTDVNNITEETTRNDNFNPPVDENIDAEAKIAEYVEQNKNDIIAGFMQGFGTNTDVTCTVDVRAEGRGIVFVICINEFDNLPEAVKNNVQSTYDGMSGVFKNSLDMVQIELPEVEYLKMDICEKDGDLIATILAQDETSVETV